jgi:NB-ARC domain
MNFNQSLTILDRLSIQQRGRRLEPIEREILGVAWDGGSYRQIEVYQEQTVKNRAVRLWKYLSELLSTKVNKYNLRQVLEELEIDYLSPELATATVETSRISRSRFCGRLAELWQLQSWVESEQRQLISISGMRGIGKTALVRKLVENLTPNLDRVIWISLAAAPPLIDVLSMAIKEVGGGRSAKLSKNLAVAIDKTINHLQKHRCLLIFDNADPVLNSDDSPSLLFETLCERDAPRTERLRQRSVSAQSQDYAGFFNRLNSSDNDICCLIIATEKYLGIDNDHRQIELQGLDRQSCQQLIYASELIGTAIEWDTLINKYQGNPQYLKIAANTIVDVFSGKIAKFLGTNILLYNQIETLLSQQLDLLSNPEMSILLWLAIEREPIDLDRLKLLTDISISEANTVKALDKLVRRYLVEIRGDRFSLPDLIMEAVTGRYHDLICQEITIKKLDILHLYPIAPPDLKFNFGKDLAKGEILAIGITKSRQLVKSILAPIIDKLTTVPHSTPPQSEILSSILFPSPQQREDIKQDLKARLRDLLNQLKLINYESIYHLETQTDDQNMRQISKMTNYAFENLTNLVYAIDMLY